MLRSEPMRRCSPDDCHAACCLNGSWVDLVEIEDILNHAAIILPHMPPEAKNPKIWFDQQQEADQFSISGEVKHPSAWPNQVDYDVPSCIFCVQTINVLCKLRPSLQINTPGASSLSIAFCNPSNLMNKVVLRWTPTINY